MKEIYEHHQSDTKTNPAIFHLDTVRYGEASAYNWHPNTELLYFVEGSGVVHMGADSVSATVGDVVVINSNLLHNVETEDIAKYYCLIPNREFCEFNGIDTENITFADKICDGEVERLYRKVVRCYERRDSDLGDALFKNAIMSLMIYIAANYSVRESGQASKNVRDNEGIRIALGYIRSHITQKLTIDELCDNAGLSKYYFVREFKRIVGDTPVVYINKLRCENAAKLLSNGQLSVGDVAEKCGFDSVSYFGKAFKKYMGMSPGAYEKSQR